MQAQLEMTPAIQEGKMSQQLPLRDNSARHRSKTKQISGQLEVAVWLGFTDNILGRMHSGIFPPPTLAPPVSTECLVMSRCTSLKLPLNYCSQCG